MQEFLNGARNRRNAILSAAATAVGMGWVGKVSAQTNSPIKIGAILSQTGPLSGISIAELKGVELAVEEINAAGGINGRKIELVNRDSASEPTKAVNTAKELAFSEKVVAVIGPGTTAEGLAATPVLAAAGIPTLVLAQLDEVIDPVKFPRAFRCVNTNTQQIETVNNYALAYMKKRKEAPKVALICDSSAYGLTTAKIVAEKLAAAGVKPVYRANLPISKPDMTDDLSKARDAGANIIIAWFAAGSPYARMMNARGNLKWDVPMMGHPLIMWPENRNLVDKIEYMNNAYGPGFRATTYGADGKLPAKTAQLLEKMRPRLGGKEINLFFWWVALGYDTVYVLANAIKAAGSTDGAAIQNVLESTKNLDLVYGNYNWSKTNRNGFPDKDMVMWSANSYKDGCYSLAPAV